MFAEFIYLSVSTPACGGGRKPKIHSAVKYRSVYKTNLSLYIFSVFRNVILLNKIQQFEIKPPPDILKPLSDKTAVQQLHTISFSFK